MATGIEERSRRYGRRIREGIITLVSGVDTTCPNPAAFYGNDTTQDKLAHSLFGTVLVRCPTDPALDPGLRPWQAGRIHLDGVRWEEKTWAGDDFIEFRDHVASLMEFTVPGDERWQSRDLPVVDDDTPAP